MREVGREIGPKKKPGALPCPAGDLFQKSRSQDPVFVVPALRPRIGEKDVDRGKSGVWRQRGQEIDVIGLHEVRIRELGALALAFGALDSLPAYVDADAMLAAMSRGIGDQEMPVTAADLPDEFRRGWKNPAKKIPQGAAALIDEGAMLGCAAKGLHGKSRAVCGRLPARFDQNH